MTPTPLGTLDHCLDQLSYPLTPEERERYVEDARRALGQLRRDRGAQWSRGYNVGYMDGSTGMCPRTAT